MRVKTTVMLLCGLAILSGFAAAETVYVFVITADGLVNETGEELILE